MFGSAALSVFGTTLIQPKRAPGVGRPTPGRRKFIASSTGCWILEQTGFQAASPPPVSRMTRAVSAGWSQCGKWPLRSNQCSRADGKAAWARAAWRGSSRRSWRPQPMVTRPGVSADPCCSGLRASSRSMASNTGVAAKLCNSLTTRCGGSSHGRVDSWASSSVRVKA